MSGADFDHTSFAVHDASAWAQRLRRELGATPIAGEALPTFRYLLLYIGTARAGARLELIEPVGSGFLTRYLERRGEGPHHITFTVPDLRATVERVRALGVTVTGEDYGHPSWQEAFIAPDDVHGVVIQLAQCDTTYPSPAELLATTERHTECFPSSSGATDPTWWTSIWDAEAGPSAELGATHLDSTDLGFSQRLFEDVLGAQTHPNDGGLDFHWPSGAVRVRLGEPPGVTAISLTDGPSAGLWVGPTALRHDTEGHPS